VFLRYENRGVLIDTSPDFRQQALTFGVDRLDAILFTHSHADHILGLDDVRPFNFHQATSIPIYGDKHTLAVIQRVFLYIFDGASTQSSRPKIVPNEIGEEPLDLFGLEFLPIPLHHGRGRSVGFRFGDAAYLTDHSEIPEASKEELRGLDVLFLDALRHKPHPTHTTVEGALRIVEELAPKRSYFTHMCHDLLHVETERLLPPGVHLAYDGMELVVELPS